MGLAHIRVSSLLQAENLSKDIMRLEIPCLPGRTCPNTLYHSPSFQALRGFTVFSVGRPGGRRGPISVYGSMHACRQVIQVCLHPTHMRAIEKDFAVGEGRGWGVTWARLQDNVPGLDDVTLPKHSETRPLCEE